jgi:AcrR family transcriptional regulator
VGRPQLHSQDAILDAARTLVLEGGARSATVTAIAELSGAPKGSIYHRFASLDDLLVEMWIRAVWRSQTAFIEALQVRDPMTAAIGGALAIYDFAERQRDDARLLAALRREDLIERVDSPHLRRQLEDLNRPLADAIAQLTRRLFARASPGNIEKTIFSVVDLPMGAIRRHLVAGTPFPHTLRDQLEAAVRAALLSAGANTSRSGSAAIRARDVATERSG